VGERIHLAAFDSWLSYVAVVVLALLAHRYVETPARKVIVRALGRKKEPVTLVKEPAYSKLSFSGR